MKKKTGPHELIKKLEKIKGYGFKYALVRLKKEADVYVSCIKEKRNLKNKIRKQLLKKSKLQIGGGKNYLEAFINIDVFKPADIIFDIRNGIPLPPESINFIFTEHFLEHLDYPVSVLNFFSESERVLRKNGKLIIGVPDAGNIIQRYVKNDKKYLSKIKKKWYKKRSIIKNIDPGIDIVNLIIRDQDTDEKYNPHFWGYDEIKLKKLFKNTGFRNVKKWTFNKEIANPKRKFGSLYMEGVKL